ncbi:hypothetical protein MANES_05G126900v8 [Manihot esculenta]|uniref:Uncharacterized protein n=1 Tax=Manihot esculenta TaxID=3983 RepID=A0A2C9VVN9_MANES|nr:hypothetical protein MANES_05G126900v8 [Manihot esculenta]
MALSSYSLMLLLVLCVSCFFAYSGFGHDFSIIGYKPEDLASHDKLFDLFESWMSKFKKDYESIDKKLKRFEIFKDNLFLIDDINFKENNYWLGLNAFADLTHEEFTKLTESPLNFIYNDVKDIPKSVDWREKGAVTSVKNQGQCGSCWAFSAAAAIEGINQIVTGNLTDLSEQQLIDCDTTSNNGCDGGNMDRAFAYIVSSGGLHKEEDYPYTMKQDTCQWKPDHKEVVTINGYEDVPRNNEESFLKALTNQPLSVAIDASSRHFQFYKGGIFDGLCGTRLNHGVVAVGYGSSHHGTNYIIVKNSWGSSWGENGYIRLKRHTLLPGGRCGIYKMASYPVKIK